MTSDRSNTLVYDAENRVLSATNGSSSCTYTYDGNNLRVKKVSGGTATVYIFSGSKVIAEYDNNAAVGSPSREYIYSGSALVAKIDSSGAKYYHQDQLSNRLVTDSSGNTVAQLGHYPFGESWYNASSEKWLFTSYERDTESFNDYALMRSYVNRLGRFSSPDLLPGSVGDPQSLNRYAYTVNDPLNLVDPAGLFYGPCGPFDEFCAPQGDRTDGRRDDPWNPSTPFLIVGGKRGGGGVPKINGPKQTFSQCMAANSSTFSLAGLANGGLNAVLSLFGKSVDFKDAWWAKALLGNGISGTLFGSAEDAAQSAASTTPGLLNAAMGTGTTYGRRTSTITALNLAGKGGLPQALSSSTSGLKSLLGAADSVLSLGMDFTTRLEVDAALAAAEAAYCIYKTK